MDKFLTALVWVKIFRRISCSINEQYLESFIFIYFSPVLSLVCHISALSFVITSAITIGQTHGSNEKNIISSISWPLFYNYEISCTALNVQNHSWHILHRNIELTYMNHTCIFRYIRCLYLIVFNCHPAIKAFYNGDAHYGYYVPESNILMPFGDWTQINPECRPTLL